MVAGPVELAERAGEKVEDSPVRRPFLGRVFDRFEHHGCTVKAFGVRTQMFEPMSGLNLGDDVEIAALVELAVHPRHRFQPSTESGLGPPNAFRHRPNPTVAGGEQRDDAVGLTKLVGS